MEIYNLVSQGNAHFVIRNLGYRLTCWLIILESLLGPRNEPKNVFQKENSYYRREHSFTLKFQRSPVLLISGTFLLLFVAFISVPGVSLPLDLKGYMAQVAENLGQHPQPVAVPSFSLYHLQHRQCEQVTQ
jgi:hypothetical protein